jgi:hypothetical protein
MKRERRIDRIPVKLDGKIKRDERGYARMWGRVVPCNAMLTYGRADGYDSDNRVEFVPESTVTDPEAVASLLFSPISMPHPPEMLDGQNTGRHQIGTVIDTKVEDGALHALHLFTDKTALDRIDQGTVELSPGYTAEIDETPGVFEGREYQAVQRGRVYNHQAVVDQARAGSSNRLFTDSMRVVSGLRIQVHKDESTHPMAMITIDGTEYEVADEVAAEMLRLQETSNDQGKPEEEVDAANPEEEGEPTADDASGAPPAASAGGAPAARGEGASGEPPVVSSTPEALSATVSVSTGGKKDAAPNTVSALLARIDGIEDRVADRIELRAKVKRDAATKSKQAAAQVYAECRPLLGTSYKADGKSAAQIMRDAIVTKNPDLKAKADAAAKDLSRLRGMLDSELARVDSAVPGHPLGDETPTPGARSDANDTWIKRKDAAYSANRAHKVLGNEAMRHASVAAAGSN